MDICDGRRNHKELLPFLSLSSALASVLFIYFAQHFRSFSRRVTPPRECAWTSVFIIIFCWFVVDRITCQINWKFIVNICIIRVSDLEESEPRAISEDCQLAFTYIFVCFFFPPFFQLSRLSLRVSYSSPVSGSRLRRHLSLRLRLIVNLFGFAVRFDRFYSLRGRAAGVGGRRQSEIMSIYLNCVFFGFVLVMPRFALCWIMRLIERWAVVSDAIATPINSTFLFRFIPDRC